MKKKNQNQNLKPDVVIKNYWNDNERFADLYNAVLFRGKQVIRAEELKEVDTDESYVFEHKEYAESMKASRDNIKVAEKICADHGIQLALLGMEGQEHIHYAMPMRTMGYDYGVYKKQYESNAQKYKAEEKKDKEEKKKNWEESKRERNREENKKETVQEKLTKDEFLSKMKKTDKFVPVITVVIYYGETPWDGAKSLHEMLNIPKELTPYVNDYKLLLVEARENNLFLHNTDNRDLFQLFQILLDKSMTVKEAKEKAIRYSTEHKTDKSVIQAVAGATKVKINYNLLEKGDGVMCTVFEEIANEGRAEGITLGKAEGIIKMSKKYKASDEDIIKDLMSELSVSEEKAEEYLAKYNKGSLLQLI